MRKRDERRRPDSGMPRRLAELFARISERRPEFNGCGRPVNARFLPCGGPLRRDQECGAAMGAQLLRPISAQSCDF